MLNVLTNKEIRKEDEFYLNERLNKKLFSIQLYTDKNDEFETVYNPDNTRDIKEVQAFISKAVDTFENVSRNYATPKTIFLKCLSSLPINALHTINRSFEIIDHQILQKLISEMSNLEKNLNKWHDLKCLSNLFSNNVPIELSQEIETNYEEYTNSVNQWRQTVQNYIKKMRKCENSEDNDIPLFNTPLLKDSETKLGEFSYIKDKIQFIQEFLKFIEQKNKDQPENRTKSFYLSMKEELLLLEEIEQYYIYYCKWSSKSVQLSANVKKFQEFMALGNEVLVLADLDMCPDLNIVTGGLENVISRYSFINISVVDIIDQDRTKQQQCFAKTNDNPIKINIKPVKKARVELQCPLANGATTTCAKEDQQWRCHWCMDYLEYDYDDNFLCSCGRTPAVSFEFRCKNPNHRTYTHFLSQESLLSLLNKLSPVQETTILVMGETGVGKSTWINAFYNYLNYPTIPEDESIKPNIQIPISFIMTDANYKQHLIELGSSNDETTTPGESRTQKITSYRIMTPDVCYRIIDTPGFGDTRGLDQDKISADKILQYISTLGKISAICFVLPPNISRLSDTFKYNVNALVKQIDQQATQNMIFCFTNSCTTRYRPGTTYKLLEGYFKELKAKQDVDIPLKPENTFCFDSEGFRYSCIKFFNWQNHCDIEFDEDEIKSYEKSWRLGSKELSRLLSYACKLPLSEITHKETMAGIKNFLVLISYPLISVLEHIIENCIIMEEDIERLKKGPTKLRRINIKWQPVSTSFLIPTAPARDKFKYRKIKGVDLEVVSQPGCICDDVDCPSLQAKYPKDPNIKKCSNFTKYFFFKWKLNSLKCLCCDAKWTKHIKVFVHSNKYVIESDSKLNTIEQINDLKVEILNLKHEKAIIFDACKKFGIYLCPDKLKGDIYFRYLKVIKRLYGKRDTSRSMNRKMNEWQTIIDDYRNERKKLISQYNPNKEIYTLVDMLQEKKRLFNLPNNGILIKELYKRFKEADQKISENTVGVIIFKFLKL